jgi:hypothetical protein
VNYAQHFDKLNPRHSPIVNTDYYRWLGGHYNDNSIVNILGYLNDRFGFVKGVDTINSRSIETHNYISDLYFRNEIASTLKQGVKQ